MLMDVLHTVYKITETDDFESVTYTEFATGRIIGRAQPCMMDDLIDVIAVDESGQRVAFHQVMFPTPYQNMHHWHTANIAILLALHAQAQHLSTLSPTTDNGGPCHVINS